MKMSLRNKMLLLIFLPFFLVVSLLFGVRYVSERQLIEEASRVSERQIEQNIRSTLGLIDESYQVVERYWEPDLRVGMEAFQKAVAEAGGDPARVDLAALKKSFGGKFDFYGIDAEGVIRYATFSPVIGLDFKKFPVFFKALEKIRQGKDFVLDRLAIELKTGNVRLWAYEPTPDNRWVLELGLAALSVKDILGKMDLQKASDNLKTFNPMLTRVQLYDVYGHLYESPDGEVRIPEALHTKILTQGEAEFIDSPNIWRRFIFINLAGGRFTPTDPSKVVELTYDRSLLNARLDSLVRTWIIFAIAWLGLLVFISLVISRGITRPLLNLHETVRHFARGDLAARSAYSSRDEMGELHASFNVMAAEMEKLLADTKTLVEKERSLRLSFVALTAAISDKLNSPALAISNSFQRLREHFAENASGEGVRPDPTWGRYEGILSDSIAAIAEVSQELSALREAGAAIESTQAMQLMEKKIKGEEASS